METVVLGKTGITVNKNGFGALPIQRVSKDEAVRLLNMALDGGITFFDSARYYSDSEEKIGLALSHRRNEFYLATKTAATKAERFWQDLDCSLKNLKTDHIDLYQFHNPRFCPKPGDESGLYDAMLEAKKQGKIRFIGITNHRLAVAREAIASGLYDTLQFPFSYLAAAQDIELVRLCETAGMGFIAMKALSGGLIQNSAAAYAWIAQFRNVLPIWGIQREKELKEFLSYITDPPALNDTLSAVIEHDRAQLSGDFCRGCGYCMPCPVGIEINTCARMSLLIRRSPKESQLTPARQKMMEQVSQCLHCGRCASRCPYGLDTPRLLEDNYRDYREILAGKEI